MQPAQAITKPPAIRHQENLSVVINCPYNAVRMPSIFKKSFFCFKQKTAYEICTKTVWKADDVHKTAATVRQYKERLGYSEQWMTDYVYNIVLLAKKEPKRKNDDTETKK